MFCVWVLVFRVACVCGFGLLCVLLDWCFMMLLCSPSLGCLICCGLLCWVAGVVIVSLFGLLIVLALLLVVDF